MTDRDLDVVARTVWGEARGESDKGVIAVAWVIRNRERDGRWPNTPLEVCTQPLQFSVWNTRDHNRSRLLSVTAEDKSYLRVLSLVTGVYGDIHSDPTGGANHYHSTSIRPSWADPNKRTAQIGGHIFYKL